MSSSELVFARRPGGCLVVECAGFEASVQDADEPAGELAQGGVVLGGVVLGGVVLGAAGALSVVQGPGAGRGSQSREGLGPERINEPVVVNEPGGDGLLLARRAGERR